METLYFPCSKYRKFSKENFLLCIRIINEINALIFEQIIMRAIIYSMLLAKKFSIEKFKETLETIIQLHLKNEC